jgi:hypothetical protein
MTRCGPWGTPSIYSARPHTGPTCPIRCSYGASSGSWTGSMHYRPKATPQSRHAATTAMAMSKSHVLVAERQRRKQRWTVNRSSSVHAARPSRIARRIASVVIGRPATSASARCSVLWNWKHENGTWEAVGGLWEVCGRFREAVGGVAQASTTWPGPCQCIWPNKRL